ncbi:hypothetical protein [Microbacterium sp. Leaf320]|uniref:hypothetical protein n=1 Tax=Microbacterium sp. Leaf320 TaxID=1736334 RepID=UPI0006FF89FC|nr:hypothetical protein [Microbacterium sp. Leaf320]KQQ65191.1 hypothetical protein ASF63_14635 [Microbacterium sp. Leaf320]
MGIFKKRIVQAYDKPAATMAPFSSPWSPQSSLDTFTADALKGLVGDGTNQPLTREIALRIPGVKRAHGIVCAQLSGIPFFQMDADTVDTAQPRWLTTSDSGVSPYHRQFGASSDWFFYGWACFGFTAKPAEDPEADCLHIPVGHWWADALGNVHCDSDEIPDEFKAYLVAVPLGYGENGLLVDGRDTLNQARKIEEAYLNRLDNPIPLTVLRLKDDMYFSYTPEQRAAVRDEWNEGRRKNSTGLLPKDAMGVDLPGVNVATDLYETGRNAVRLDIANHVSLPASVLEGVRQGGSGGGTEMRYQGVGENGTARSELWDYGPARRMLLAFEARMSLDDIVPTGKSIRGDLTNMFATPDPTTTPTSED